MDIENLNLEEYDFIAPSEIQIVSIEPTKFIDITVEDDNSFFVKLENSDKLLLSHNCDGHAISAQLLNLFFTYWPRLFKEGKIQKVYSPIIEAKKKGSKKIENFYSIKEYNKVKDKYDIIKYNKGLGSLSRATYKEMISNPKLKTFSFDEKTEEYLEMLFGKSNQDARKDWIK